MNIVVQPEGMRLVVDLTRCQGYGQCVFAAPEVFRMPGAEALLYESNPAMNSARRSSGLRQCVRYRPSW